MTPRAPSGPSLRGDSSSPRLGNDGESRIAFTPRFVTNSVDVAIGHAELGGGVTMALSYQVESNVARGSLALVLPRFEPPSQPIQLVYATRRHLSANVRAFVEHVTTKCAWRFVDL